MRRLVRLVGVMVVFMLLPGNFAGACGGDWYPPWRPALFNPQWGLSAWSGQAEAFAAENIAEWRALIPGADEDDIRAFVYASKPLDLQRLRARYEKDEKPVRFTRSGRVEEWIFRNKQVAVLDYLLFAKECESWLAGVSGSRYGDDAWTYRKTDENAGGRLASLAERRLQTVGSDFLRLRYSFQALRLYHALRWYERAVVLFRTQVESLESDLVCKDWCRAWYAGALHHSRDYPGAFREAATVRRHGGAYSSPMALTARWALRKDPDCIDRALQLCRTPEDRLDVRWMACLADVNSDAATTLLREVAASRETPPANLPAMLAVLLGHAQGPYAEVDDDSTYFKAFQDHGAALRAYWKDLENGLTALSNRKDCPQPARIRLMAANLAFLREDLPAARKHLAFAEQRVSDPETGLQLFVLQLAVLAADPGGGENDARLAAQLRLLRYFAGYAENEPDLRDLPAADNLLFRRVRELCGPPDYWSGFLGDAGAQIVGGILPTGLARAGRPHLGPACVPASTVFYGGGERHEYFYEWDATHAVTRLSPEQTARLRGMLEKPAGPLEAFLASSPGLWKREELVDMEGERFFERGDFTRAALLLEREGRGGHSVYWGNAPERPDWTTDPAVGIADNDMPVLAENNASRLVPPWEAFGTSPSREPWAFGYEISLREIDTGKEKPPLWVAVNTSDRPEKGVPPCVFDVAMLARSVGVWDLPMPKEFSEAGETAEPLPPVWNIAGWSTLPSPINRKLFERCLWLLSQEAPDTRSRAEHMLALDWLIRVGDAHDPVLADRARYIQAKYVFAFHAPFANDFRTSYEGYDWTRPIEPTYNPAQERFVALAERTKDRELAARALFMAALCRQKDYVAANQPYLKDNPPFAALHARYRDTAFYRNAVDACSYLRDFVSSQK